MDNINIINERNVIALNLPEIDMTYFAKYSLRVAGTLAGGLAGALYAGYFKSHSPLGPERDVTLWEDSKVAGVAMILFGCVIGYGIADCVYDCFFVNNIRDYP